MAILVEIKKRLATGARVFSLDVAFASETDLTVLYGPSGSGKSLTLKAVAGLLQPERGRIVIDGQVFFDSAARIKVPPRRRRVGYVPQDYALFPHLKVKDNITFGLRRPWQRRLRREETRRVEEMLELFDLKELRDSYPEEISGGQRQRVALARALILRPRILLLDEPFAALDGFLRVKMRQALLDVQAHFRLPLILITHDPEDVAALAQTLVVYEGGRVNRVAGREDFPEETSCLYACGATPPSFCRPGRGR